MIHTVNTLLIIAAALIAPHVEWTDARFWALISIAWAVVFFVLWAWLE